MEVPVQKNREMMGGGGSRDEGIEDEDGLASQCSFKQQKTSNRSLKGTKTQRECILSASPRFPQGTSRSNFSPPPENPGNKG